MVKFKTPIVTYKTFEDIKDVDTNAYIEDLSKLTEEEATTIKDIADFYGKDNLHRPEHSTLRDNIIRDAIYKNGTLSNFVLKSVELSIIFYDERWYEMTRDFGLSRRAYEFDTSVENVAMYDQLHDAMIDVLTKPKVKSK